MHKKQQIVIFGSTGSIGTSTLEVLRLHPNLYQVFALSGHSNRPLLLQQCLEFKPQYALMQNPTLAHELQNDLISYGLKIKVLQNSLDLAYLASHPEVDIVMSAIVGSAGLIPTYQAALSGKRILLANKESLVAGGDLITKAVKQSGGELIPVDSEHSAIYQALPYNYSSLDEIGVSRIILTASGGPFLNSKYTELQHVEAAQAIKHPNWTMGQKISVDSATLMNKGLELIEAYWLFACTPKQLEVIIHPQSIIHSMVEYIDGSILAQLGTPDMKTPIAYALSAPKRIASGSEKLNFLKLQNLTFQEPDLKRFPCLKIALEGLQRGGNIPAIINAANEMAVHKFLQNKIGFYDIPKIITSAVDKFASSIPLDLEALLQLDHEVRSYCTYQ